MLGKDNLPRLLIVKRAPNKARLKIPCPFYPKLAEVPKTQLLGVLRSQIKAALETKGHHYQYLSSPSARAWGY